MMQPFMPSYAPLHRANAVTGSMAAPQAWLLGALEPGGWLAHEWLAPSQQLAHKVLLPMRPGSCSLRPRAVPV